MSSLKEIEKRYLEDVLQMASGYVLDFSDRTFESFFSAHDIPIHSATYLTYGSSKAKKLRSFWDQEPDLVVGRVLSELIEVYENGSEKGLWEISERELQGAKKAVSRLLNSETSGSRGSKNFFLATLTIRITDRSFPDFMRSGTQSNLLPKFQDDISSLQTQLEELELFELSIPQRLTSENVIVSLQDFSITSLTYTEGSVVAKVKIGCTVVFTVVGALAAYPDAKVGLGELRKDISNISTQIFEEIKEHVPSQPEPEKSVVSYYFLRPETAEENLNKLYRGVVVDAE